MDFSKETIKLDSSQSIELKHISKNYRYPGKNISVLSDINLSISVGEHICLTGKSGCGKTTLARIICGIEPPSAGEVTVFGINPISLFANNRKEYSRTLQLMQQESYLLYDPLYTILDALLRTVTLHHPQIKDGKSRLEYIYTVMENYYMVDLSSLLHRKPKELSGGQLQRLALLRLFLASPRIIIADEPTAMLDSYTTKKIVDAFCAISNEITLIYITHNSFLTYNASDRIIAIDNGRCI